MGRWIAVLAASLAAHAAILTALGASAVRGRSAVSEPNPIDIAFTLEEPTPLEAGSASVAAGPPSPPVVAPNRPPETSRPKLRRRLTAPLETTTPTHVPNLDPESAARALFRSGGSSLGAARKGSPAVAAPGDARETPHYFEGIGEKRYLSEREPPKLKRSGDGTYRYRGRAFEAIVAKDGSVSFDDGYKQGTTVSFDITDALMRRRGEDPYRYEKDWFLESTDSFRQQLFERWKTKRERLALTKLRVRLLRILEDATLSAGQKEARVLAIFRSTGDDEAGEAARKTIAEFVARRMPGIELSGPTL